MTMTQAVAALALKTAVVAGAGASSNITVTGIATEDTLIAVQESETGTADPTDRTSTSSITAVNTIQCTDVTTGDKLIVLYHDASATTSAALALKVFLGTGNAANTNITVTGIGTEDTLLGVYEILLSDAIWIDRTSTSSITATNIIQSTSAFTNTTSDQCLVIYHDASAPADVISSPCLRWTQCNGSATTSTVPGIKTEDKLLMVLELTVTSNVAVDRLSTSTITATNTLTNGVATDNDILLVLWHDASA